MTSFNDLEESLKKFMIEEQSDAHHNKSLNLAKYNNICIYMDDNRFQQPHFIVRISISEATFLLNGCQKINGGLGFEERFVTKWFGRMGIKDKLQELWNDPETHKFDK